MSDIRNPERHAAAKAKRNRRRGSNRARPPTVQRVQLDLFKSFLKAIMRKRKALWEF